MNIEKPKRKALGNSKRFKVFERDGYKCRYCGQQPPEVVLEVDHFIPVKEGGQNDFNNLLTSCKECNQGKKARISRAPGEELEYKSIIVDKKEVLQQLKNIALLNAKIDREIENMVEGVVFHWEYIHDEKKTLTVRGKTTIRNYLKIFQPNEIIDAMNIALIQSHSSTDTFKYMCGVLQNWKKGIGNKPENIWQQQ